MLLAPFHVGTCADESAGEQTFLPATLEHVRRCPARAEYIELCFTTPEGSWNWCFPEPERVRKRSASPIALTLGPYGIVARKVIDTRLGTVVDTAAAVPMILAGAEVVVARRLVTATR
jgi:hypothetical protein